MPRGRVGREAVDNRTLEVAMVKPQSPATATRQVVSDVMHDPEPVVEQSAHLTAAANMMRHARRPELVVVDDEALRTPIAIITAFDVTSSAPCRTPLTPRTRRLPNGSPRSRRWSVRTGHSWMRST
jgi:hypothetical protein